MFLLLEAILRSHHKNLSIRYTHAAHRLLSSDTIHRLLSSDTIHRLLSSDTVHRLLSSGTVHRLLSSGTVHRLLSSGTIHHNSSLYLYLYHNLTNLKDFHVYIFYYIFTF